MSAYRKNQNPLVRDTAKTLLSFKVFIRVNGAVKSFRNVKYTCKNVQVDAILMKTGLNNVLLAHIVHSCQQY
jgi:hypothetical protein